MMGYELAVACLALNIYHEAAFEPLEGKQAVALVTINRVQASGVKDVCGIVFEHKQFSWTIGATDAKGKLLPKYLPQGEHWRESRRVALAVMNGEVQDFTDGATHFYADYIPPPYWAAKKVRTGKWGKHIFMRRM
jgi:spore germination cell wall hydrolase CwlJ-like protein